MEVVVGAGGGTHSSGALGAADAAGRKAVEGMQEVVRKQSGVGEQLYLRNPPLVAITMTRLRPTFPVRLVISPRYMQLTLASGARTVTNWGICTNTARCG